MQGKLSWFSFISVEGPAIPQSIHREDFHDSSKIHETVKLFFLSFTVHYTLLHAYRAHKNILKTELTILQP